MTADRVVVRHPVYVMVSGCITFHGRSSFVVYPPHTYMNAVEYVRVLREEHLPMTLKVMHGLPFTWIDVQSPLRSLQTHFGDA
jgi:hypothetical protein